LRHGPVRAVRLPEAGRRTVAPALAAEEAG